MTRDEQVRKALKLLAPPGFDHEKARETPLSMDDFKLQRQQQAARDLALRTDIARALDAVERILPLRASTKEATKARDAYHRVVCRLRAAHITLVRVSGGHGYFKLADIDRVIEETAPTRHIPDTGRNERRRIYYAGSPGTPISAAPQFGGRKESTAVQLAHELLTWWRAGEEIVTTKGGKWWRLAAILYGDPGRDLYQHLAAFQLALTRKYARDRK